MNKTKGNNRPRRSVSFLTRLRPDNLVPQKRSTLPTASANSPQHREPLEW